MRNLGCIPITPDGCAGGGSADCVDLRTAPGYTYSCASERARVRGCCVHVSRVHMCTHVRVMLLPFRVRFALACGALRIAYGA